MYIVTWKRIGEDHINREFCSDLEEASRWKKCHMQSSECEFCHIEKN